MCRHSDLGVLVVFMGGTGFDGSFVPQRVRCNLRERREAGPLGRGPSVVGSVWLWSTFTKATAFRIGTYMVRSHKKVMEGWW